ncbi:hypothetical protein AADEFJLK_01105 [Methylovulum psychrotolerans]|uniref:Porin domain-containing protein n=1 Tax=Methylovulum psychrotolerans TaxID=1704499 RepID=A0A2S5CTL6_9GAMM|nr:hypothetical protein AADEFJLK_01105 [Methylovulum psychrotolerans]
MSSRSACYYVGAANGRAVAKPLAIGRMMPRLVFCLCLLASGRSGADNKALPLTLHYFGTAGLAHSGSGQAEFVRDLSQPDGVKSGQWSATVDSLAGLQANLTVNDQLEIVGQGVSRYHFGGTYLPELTWAYAKYSPRPELDLRGGRLGVDFYMRADSRLVGYSYLPVRPAVDYYGGLPYQYIDGLDGTVKLPMGKGILRAKLFGGYSPEKIPPAWDVSGALVLGGNLGYQWDSWQLRFSYTQIQHARDLARIQELLAALRGIPRPETQAAADALTVQDTISRHYSLGMTYDKGPWQVELMVSGAVHETASLQDNFAGYLLAGYRVGAVTPYAGLSWSQAATNTIGRTKIPLLDAAVAKAIGASHSNQHTFMLGLRWDFYRGMDAKIQWDTVLGSPDSVFLVRGEQPGWNGQTDVLSATLDFAY